MSRRALAIATLAFIAAAATVARAEPDNDAFASASDIGPGPVAAVVSTNGGTTEPSEPLWCLHAQNLDATVWFRYIPTTTERITVRTLQTTSSFGHFLAIYTGTDVAALRHVGCRNNDSVSRGATVDLLATEGTAYMIQVAARSTITASMRLLVVPSAAGDITGRVSDTGSAPVAGICVRASALTSEIAGSTESGPDGRYTLTVPAGAYLVQFFDCHRLGYTSATAGGDDFAILGDIVVRPGERTEGIDATLQRYATIEGRVISAAGDPISFICVHRLSEEGSLTPWPVMTNSDGRYLLRDILPGSYRIKFIDCREQALFVSEWYDDEPTWRTAQPVAVAEGAAVTGIDAELAPAS